MDLLLNFDVSADAPMMATAGEEEEEWGDGEVEDWGLGFIGGVAFFDDEVVDPVS